MKRGIKYDFFLFFFVFFIGCSQSDYSKEECQNSIEQLKVCENEKNMLEKKSYEFIGKYYELSTFLNVFFFDKDFHNFSLDDSLIVLYGNENNNFIYSKTKNQLWSGHCGVLEKLSKKQTEGVDSLLNLYVSKLKSLDLKGETWSTLAIWKPRSARQLQVYSVGYDIPNQRFVLKEYFSKYIFVNGCVRHIFSTYP